MAKRISKEAEVKIMTALEKVAALVNNGLAPNDAIIKVAQEGQIVPGHIRLMVQAYNTGRTNVQRKSADDPLEKSAEFPVADAKTILEALYPPTIKTASQLQEETIVSEEYARPPDWVRKHAGIEKAARHIETTAVAAYPRNPGRLTNHALNLVRDCGREAEENRRQLSACRDKVAALFEDLDLYFRQPGCTPFVTVMQKASSYFGRPAAVLLNKIAEANPRITKIASVMSSPVDWNAEPYSLVSRCLNAVREHGRLQSRNNLFNKEAGEKVGDLLEAILPTAEPKYCTGSVLEALQPKKVEKRALLGTFGDALRATVAVDAARKIMGKVPVPGASDSEKLQEDAFAGVTDPLHEARLGNMRAQFMLSNLMANDPVISSYPPEEVTSIFNQISQLAPRAAGKEMLVRALLRRHLSQGQVDTHEVDQLAGIESKLKQRDEPVDTRKFPATLPFAPGKKKKEEEKQASVLVGIG